MDAMTAWKRYAESELERVTPVLSALGFTLDPTQPHISGERYLMQALTTEHGKKLILLGRSDADGRRVIIKATSDPAGMREIERERMCRRILHDMKFAYEVFLTPTEILFRKDSGFMVSVQQFIDQERPFLSRSIYEQYSLALKSFKAQESAHATTYGHLRVVKATFGERRAEQYLSLFEGFRAKASRTLPRLEALLASAKERLSEHKENIERYAGFLTHIDFVPHNFRVVGSDIYLLDHSSIVFGNKYEGWARFLNFMTLYNPLLERALAEYVKLNRTPEESDALASMRIYRLGEIICYYTDALSRTSGDLHELERHRIDFWSAVLESSLEGAPLPDSVRDSYVSARDALRSPEEKKRQVGLH